MRSLSQLYYLETASLQYADAIAQFSSCLFSFLQESLFHATCYPISENYFSVFFTCFSNCSMWEHIFCLCYSIMAKSRLPSFIFSIGMKFWVDRSFFFFLALSKCHVIWCVKFLMKKCAICLIFDILYIVPLPNHLLPLRFSLYLFVVVCLFSF